MRELRYPYKPGSFRALLVTVLFGWAAYFMIRHGNSPGLGSLAGGAALVGAILFIVSITSRKELILTDTTLTLPASLYSTAPTAVQTSEITQLKLQKVGHRRYLYVYHKGGMVGIEAANLPIGAFDKICAELNARVPRPAA